MEGNTPANVLVNPQTLQFWRQRYLLALDGRFPCIQCGAQMETEMERLALRCRVCGPVWEKIYEDVS